MVGLGPRIGRRRLVAAASALTIVASLLAVTPASVLALVTVGSNITGGSAISLDTTSAGGTGAYTPVSGPSFAASAGGDFATGNIVFTLPAGFEFNTAAGSAGLTGPGCSGLIVASTVVGATSVTINLTGPNSGVCTVSVGGLQIRPTNTVPSGGLVNYTATSFVPPIGANVGSVNSVPGAPAAMSFSTQPSFFATGGVPFATQPVVFAVDQFGNNATGRVVALGLQGGALLGMLSCTSTTATVDGSGFATFAGCRIDRASIVPYQLTARHNLLGAPILATSTNVFVSAGPPTQLQFVQWPSSPTPALLVPQPWVQVTDAGGNPVAVGGLPVSLSLIGPFTSSLTCDSDVALPNVKYTNAGGLAQFTNCVVSPAGSYWLRASAPLLLDDDSPTFTVSGASGQVVFTQQPLGANIGGATPVGGAGVAWSIQPIVQLRTAGGVQLFQDNTSQVTLSIAPGTPITGGPGTLTCTGGNTLRVTQGVAAFSGCSINTIGTGYQLRATVTYSTVIPIGSNATSLGFNIGTGMQLAFSQYPQVGVPLAAGAVWPSTSQPIVAVVDGAGHVLPNAPNYTIQLAIATGTGPVGAVLTCTQAGNQALIVNGYATFSGCKIDRIGTGYKLIASVTVLGGPPSVTGNAFNVALAAATITLATYPSVVTWGDPFTLTIQFSVTGNHTFTVQRMSPIDGGQFVNILTGTTDSTGRAVMQYSPRFNGQYKVVFAGDTTAGAATSNTTTVNVRNLVLLRPSWSGVKNVSKGFTQTYNATVRPFPSGGIPGGVAQVEFQFWQLSNGIWVKRGSAIASLNSSGVGSITKTWNTKGQWYIRARTLPNIYNFWGTSDLERLNVQ